MMDFLNADFLTLMWFFARAIPAFSVAFMMWFIPAFIVVGIFVLAGSNN